ncbi:hypothetical protein PMAYCL1PPCAC_09375, partial [Pristionchus mayeri]
ADQKVPLPANTEIYMRNDLTIFYHYTSNHGSPERLYAKIDGREVDAALSDDRIYGVFLKGNALYFTSPTKVHKAFLNSRGVIEVSYVRGCIEVRGCMLFELYVYIHS